MRAWLLLAALAAAFSLEDTPRGALPEGCVVEGPLAAAATRGGRSLALTRTEGEGAAKLRCTLGDASLAGQRVALALEHRSTRGPQHGAELGLNALDDDGQLLTWDRSPSLSEAWSPLRLALELPPETASVQLVVLLREVDAFELRGLSLRALGPASEPAPAAPLSADERRALVALARLYGPLRWFADLDPTLDWDSFALHATRTLLDAPPQALEHTLLALVQPLAPGFTLNGEAPAEPPSSWWVHHGLASPKGGLYHSLRAPGEQTPQANLTATLDAAPYRGRKVTLSWAFEGELSGRATLYEQAPDGFPMRGGGRPLKPGAGSVSLRISPYAPALQLGFHVEGEGEARLSALTLDGAPLPLGGPEGHVPEPWSFSDGRSTALARVEVEGDAARISLRTPSPAPAWQAELAPGLRAALPTHNELARWDVPLLVGRPSDRASRLASVVVAWATLRQFYPYFDPIEGDWDAALITALEDAALADTPAAWAATLDRLMGEGLQDGHGFVQVGRYGGEGPSEATKAIPVRFGLVEGQLIVNGVDPASDADVHLGERLLAIDGEPAEQRLAWAEARVPASTPQVRAARASDRLSTCTRPTQITLGETLEDSRSLTLPCGGTSPSRQWDRPGERLEIVQELGDGLLYVDLNRLTPAQLEDALPRLVEARGLVIDLRVYPKGAAWALISHMSPTPVSSARWQVPVVARADQEAMAFDLSNWVLHPVEPQLPQARVVLIGPRAVSAAETALGIIEHYELAPLVGEPTAGTNGNITSFILPEGSELSFTGMRVEKHDGSPHHGMGIQPTHPVSPTRAGVTADRDEVLEAGIKQVRAMVEAQGEAP